MKTKQSFFSMVCALAIPAALQSMLQSSFSMIDQIMIGQLGSAPISAVGFAGKFFSIFSVIIAAVGAVASIMISQYLGQNNGRQVRRSFSVSLWLALGLALLVNVLSLCFSHGLMSLYTKDEIVRQIAAEYLTIISVSALPMAAATILATYFRCIEKPALPMIATIISAALNTALNYILIFGCFGLPAMGAKGAAIATAFSQLANFLIMLLMFFATVCLPQKNQEKTSLSHFHWKQYAAMLLPILICEVAWSLGENVYAAIYGHMSTDEAAAMNLISPVQGLVIGALCGLSQAAGVIVGKQLGNRSFDNAYRASKKLMIYGAVGSAILSMIVVLSAPFYVNIYQVEPTVKVLTRQILYAYALVAPFKVLNMILGGGIIRSGGKTKYVMFVDIIGTWCFGVPLGMLSAFVWNLPIAYVYFFLSLEECVRFGISILLFRRRKWMNCLESEPQI